MWLKSVTAGLPVSLWVVLLVGAVLNIAVTWFFHMRSQSVHFWMTVIFSALLGLLIFLLAAMDHHSGDRSASAPKRSKWYMSN